MAMIANPTGAYGYGASDGNVMSHVVMYFDVAGSASAATTITRGQVVGFNATYQVVAVSAGETGMVIGVALETVTVPKTDTLSYQGPRTVPVCVLGVCEVLSGGTGGAVGANLYADATGRALGTGSATAGDYNVGWALDAPSAAGTYFTAWVSPSKQQ